MFKKNEVIFNEGESALFFYFIISGGIRMFNRNEEGKEFVQGYFLTGQSFGEPPLFIDESYPTTAACIKDSMVLKLSKNKFFNMLEDIPELKTLFIKILSKRIVGKAKSSKDIINQNTEQKIISFLMIQKPENIKKKIFIPFTRQEIANFTGLRVETVIRACSKLKKTGIIEIINHKIYF
ncbi:Crp/Fnr family transcriptional regulator [Flavobacterium covae]|uniref:Crp/Fnr family transcriptional regulator n=1 Tax=Flavobacterium covae TaxID=2906076 RepID=UPI0007C58FA9|nr:Crp/Fnr family transcriptional regulator [Flavobacterium covae]